jgi:hypothetical protein
MDGSCAIVLGLGLMLFGAGTTRADGYAKWVNDEKKQEYTCEYSYSTKDGCTSKQRVVIFYGDKDRSGWAYFYNAKQEPWTRCAIPGNSKYNPKQMCWQKLNSKADGYEDYPTNGYCPTPKDGKSAIPELPLPPK